MRIAVLTGGYAEPHAGWVAIDEWAELLAGYFQAPLLSPKPLPPVRWREWLGRPKPRWEPLQEARGDVLLLVARAPTDLAMIQAIPDLDARFPRRYAWITDSYFQAGFVEETRRFHGITVTAEEDIALPRDRFRIPVHRVYQGADGLRWAPRSPVPRSIDVIGFGRMPPSYHRAFCTRFHSADSPALYLHSPLGTLRGPEVHRERGMLFKLLQRSRVALAFHLLVEPQGNRPTSMMVTSRWLESLLSGCLVAGKRPVSQMADDMLAWPGATFELADDARAAVTQLESMLTEDPTTQGAQRQRNIAETLRRHDWRHRIRELCRLFELPEPAKLAADLAAVEALAAQFSTAASAAG